MSSLWEGLVTRRGRFRVSIACWDDPEAFMEMLSGMMILQCEPNFIDQEIEYTACSPMFDEIARGDLIPDYRIVTTVDVEGKHTYSAVKVRRPCRSTLENTFYLRRGSRRCNYSVFLTADVPGHFSINEEGNQITFTPDADWCKAYGTEPSLLLTSVTATVSEKD